MPCIEHKIVRSLVFSLLFFRSGLARRTCYWPDGSNVTDPYDACQSGDSSCCSQGEICLSNNLCFGPSIGLVYRGACTRQDWDTPACSRQCNDIINTRWANLYTCNDGTWWCGTTSGPCQENDKAHIVPWTAATFVATIPTVDSDAASTSFTVTSSIQSATQSASQPVTLSAAQPQTSSTVPGSPSSMPTINTDNNSGGSQTKVAIGVGVGVPLSVMALGWFSFLVWRERRRRPVPEEVHEEHLARSTLQENNKSCHEIDGNIAVSELPVQREFWR